MDWAEFLLGNRLKSVLIKPVANKAESKTPITDAKSVPASKPAEKSAKPVEKPLDKAAVKEVKKRKLFFMDAEYLAVIALLVIVLFGAKAFAFSISAPDSVIVTDKAVFTVDLTNDSSQAANVVMNFYSPAQSTISYPKQLAPNSSGKATITINNNISKVEDISATIEAVVGEEKVQKEVTLSFKENPSTSLGAAFGAFFSIPLFNEEIASFSGADWVIFWVLTIIAAVLIVAFVSRLVRRSR